MKTITIMAVLATLCGTLVAAEFKTDGAVLNGGPTILTKERKLKVHLMPGSVGRNFYAWGGVGSPAWPPIQPWNIQPGAPEIVITLSAAILGLNPTETTWRHWSMLQDGSADHAGWVSAQFTATALTTTTDANWAAGFPQTTDVYIGGDAPPAPDSFTWSTTGTSWYPETVHLTVKIVESEAYNHIYTAGPVAIGAATGASLAHSGTETEPSVGWFSGKHVTAFLTGLAGELDVAGPVTIPDRDGDDRHVTFNFGNAGKSAPPPATPTTTTPDPTNTGNQNVPPTPVTPPETTTAHGTTTTGSSSTGANAPASANTPSTAVNNGSTTISGTAAGATVQDIYEAVKNAIVDAAAGTGAGSGSGSGGGGLTVPGNVDFGEQVDGLDGSLQKQKIFDTADAVDGIITAKKTQFNPATKGLTVPSVTGTNYVYAATLPVIGSFNVDVTPYTSIIQFWRNLCLLFVTVLFYFAAIKSIRASIA